MLALAKISNSESVPKQKIIKQNDAEKNTAIIFKETKNKKNYLQYIH